MNFYCFEYIVHSVRPLSVHYKNIKYGSAISGLAMNLIIAYNDGLLKGAKRVLSC